jgi:tRNA(adenine34) deaminase
MERAADRAMTDEDFMREALNEARQAETAGEVPVGAVIVKGGQVISRGRNRREADQDPLAHAEIEAIRQAARNLESFRLTGCTLFVTLEPCAMCAGALVNSRIERLVFGAHDPKAGFVGSLGNLVQDARLNHRLEVTAGVLAEESSTLLKAFFANLRRDL